MSIIKKAIKGLYTRIINPCINKITANQSLDTLIEKVTKYYKNNPNYQEAITILNREGFTSFPFKWVNEYSVDNIQVFYEDAFPYVLHNSKKLFFPKTFSEQTVKEKYNALLIEQDPRSTHCYFSKDFILESETTFLDVGSAEGIIPLSFIDSIKSLYLFECDPVWIDALKKTFYPYKNKTKIICKYVSDTNNANSITLDTFLEAFDKSSKLFIKADIEGFEKNMIKGCRHVFNDFSSIQLSICTYHHIQDKKKLTKYLKNLFYIQYSESFMIWPWLAKRYKLKPPYFVTGIIRATKKN